MKRLVTGLFVATTLLASAGCSSAVKSNETPASNSEATTQIETQKTKSVSDNAEKSPAHSMDHSHHQEKPQNATTTQAKLTAPKNLAPKQPLNLTIEIQDQAGKPINKFDVFQEKLMHLIVVSNDLAHFDHLHPEYKDNGRFQVSANFPSSGEYTLFSDYKPAGQTETLSLTNITIPGTVALPKSLSKYEKTKTISDTKVNLNISTEKIKAGEDVSLAFAITDKNNQPVKDMKLYLGEKGHLVIIKSSSVLKKSDYIHAHAMKDTPDGEVKFHTAFPQSGTYKMWMQFNRNGNIKTADFWVNVE
jgi:protocatechuate 3,4-dioxygenase beta subunit